MRVILLLLAFIVSGGPASAHIPPGGYLRLTVEGNSIHGTWDLSLYSLAQMAGVMDKSPAALQDFALQKLAIEADGKACTLNVDKAASQTGSNDGAATGLITITGECPRRISKLTIDYFALFVIDPNYQGLVNVSAHGQTFTSALSTRKPYVTFQMGAPDRWQQFRDYLRAGVWHIWLGYDHILFLVSLLLSSAFVIKRRRWTPRHGLASTFWQVTKIVTSFTVAHSVTLGLVIFNVIALPSRLVELMIALSIIIAAANNLYPLLSRHLWLLTFFFGLIHGMGFAGALKELGLPEDARWLALAGFNLGVEAGQLTIVAAVLPVIYAMRNYRFYRTVPLPAASCLIIAVALIWFVQRAFAVTLLHGILGG